MLVVGAGECGARAVLTLREEGYTGPVSLVGAERHAPYERPPLSKEAMLADVRPEARAVATLALLEETGVTFLSSIEALAIDRDRRSVRLSTGASLPYARLLIATGATPRRLALAERSRRCVYLRTFDDALAIRTHLHAGVRLAVIGGGFIGLELAAAARRLGCAVTVIEAQPRILVRGVPAEIAAALHAEHEAQGALIAVGAAITAIDDTDGAVRISLTSGDDIEADLAIIGIGAVPATRLAETAGLPVDNGITVDDCLRTGDPAIFAAGDCCAFPLPLYGGRRVRLEAWRNAQEQGARAARNMLGAEEPQSAVPWFWSDQVRSRPADHRPARRRRHRGATRPRGRRVPAVSPRPRRPAGRRQRHRPRQRRRPRHPAGRDADRPARRPAARKPRHPRHPAEIPARRLTERRPHEDMTMTRARPTVADLRSLKGKRQLTMLRVFTLDEAAAAEAAGIDIVSIPPDLLLDPQYRDAAPSLFSMPGDNFFEIGTADDFVRWAFRLYKAGADAVYCSASYATIRRMADEAIPVIGHVGLIPSRRTWTGGWKAVGKTADGALEILEAVRALEAAGAIGAEIEVVPVEVAQGDFRAHAASDAVDGRRRRLRRPVPLRRRHPGPDEGPRAPSCQGLPRLRGRVRPLAGRTRGRFFRISSPT